MFSCFLSTLTYSSDTISPHLFITPEIIFTSTAVNCTSLSIRIFLVVNALIQFSIDTRNGWRSSLTSSVAVPQSIRKQPFAFCILSMWYNNNTIIPTCWISQLVLSRFLPDLPTNNLRTSADCRSYMPWKSWIVGWVPPSSLLLLSCSSSSNCSPVDLVILWLVVEWSVGFSILPDLLSILPIECQLVWKIFVTHDWTYSDSSWHSM